MMRCWLWAVTKMAKICFELDGPFVHVRNDFFRSGQIGRLALPIEVCVCKFTSDHVCAAIAEPHRPSFDAVSSGEWLQSARRCGVGVQQLSLPCRRSAVCLVAVLFCVPYRITTLVYEHYRLRTLCGGAHSVKGRGPRRNEHDLRPANQSPILA